jgi:thioredoxin reductase (NADPH)
MLPYSDHVAIVTNGHSPSWTGRHELWITEYRIPHYQARIVQVDRRGACIRALHLEDGLEVHLDALFTTRGDIYFNELAKELGAKVNAAGDVVVDLGMRTTVEGLYAAGCVTPANCQMIIAAAGCNRGTSYQPRSFRGESRDALAASFSASPAEKAGG